MMIRVAHDGREWSTIGVESSAGVPLDDHGVIAAQVDRLLAGVDDLPESLRLTDGGDALSLVDLPRQTAAGLVAQYATTDHGERARLP